MGIMFQVHNNRKLILPGYAGYTDQGVNTSAAAASSFIWLQTDSLPPRLGPTTGWMRGSGKKSYKQPALQETPLNQLTVTRTGRNSRKWMSHWSLTWHQNAEVTRIRVDPEGGKRDSWFHRNCCSTACLHWRPSPGSPRRKGENMRDSLSENVCCWMPKVRGEWMIGRMTKGSGNSERRCCQRRCNSEGDVFQCILLHCCHYVFFLLDSLDSLDHSLISLDLTSSGSGNISAAAPWSDKPTVQRMTAGLTANKGATQHMWLHGTSSACCLFSTRL